MALPEMPRRTFVTLLLLIFADFLVAKTACLPACMHEVFVVECFTHLVFVSPNDFILLGFFVTNQSNAILSFSPPPNNALGTVPLQS